ncbi:ABC transporter ATP-binding protein [Ferviditalea candida]|uniref:ABC transporter ATP-binding protein n=1 Tax=Ferviditalea candida TaxID=3108399 RepID=A0ABU5ZD80_9BACL|nr:ABC transporter ATP-binding protein [Paenibacillaceae bacterium T2]
MKTVLSLERVVGGYSLNKPVLHGISFQVHPGEMVGLIGLNGAGKSTIMKHILGLIKPQGGSISIYGRTLDEDPEAYRSSFAYVPETPLLYNELTVREHLRLTAMAYGIHESDYRARADRLLEEFHMFNSMNTLSEHLSKGMRQKVMIMSAFLAEPSLYIIDEPFLGLDPLGIRSLLERMQRMKRQGSSVLLSSHILSMIETFCDRFVVLHEGSILAQGTLEEIGRQAGLSGRTLEELFYSLVKGGK